MLQRWSRVAVFAGILALFGSMAVLSQAQESSTPRVWSIVPTPADGPMVTFTVTFSEPVTGVDPSDFRLLDTKVAHIQNVQRTTAPDVYSVTVGHDSTAADILLLLIDDDSIVNGAGIPLGGLGAKNGNAVSTQQTIAAKSVATRHTNSGSAALPRSLSRILGTTLSLTMTSIDTAVIAYYDSTNNDLKLAICDTLECNYPATSVIAATNESGFFAAVAVTSSNIPVIAFSESRDSESIYNLKLAVCNNAACSSPVITTIDSNPLAGGHVAIAINASDIPIISYHDFNGTIKIAVCNNSACTSPTIRTLDNVGYVGQDGSIALTSTGVPVISYSDGTNADLELAVCADATCSSHSLVTLDSDGYVGRFTSIAMTSADAPIVSYLDDSNTNLKLAICNNTACSSPTLKTIDNVGDVGYITSIALTASDAPVISYFDLTNDSIKVAICDVTACTNPTFAVQQRPGTTGIDTGIALSSDDRYVLSYHDGLVGGLSYAISPIILDKGQPDVLHKVSPVNTTTVSTTSAILGWNAAVGAVSYDYCIALSTVPCITWTTVGASTNHTVTGLENAKTYTWQVRAINVDGTTQANSGTPWQFTVVYPPTTFAKTAPRNNAPKQKTSLALSWAASTYATSYEYCVAFTTATCTNWKSTGSARTATVSGLLKGKSYYWQVRAKNAGGTTLSASTFWKFTTAK